MLKEAAAMLDVQEFQADKGPLGQPEREVQRSVCLFFCVVGGDVTHVLYCVTHVRYSVTHVYMLSPIQYDSCVC